MNKNEALQAIHNGTLINCSKEDYENEIRLALQDRAGELIDMGDHLRAMMHLEEVKRHDKLFSES